LEKIIFASFVMARFKFKDLNDFEKVRTDAEEFYASIGEIRCPYFGEKVSFNASGLKHLKFKSDKVARSHSEQYVRLKLLPFAPQVLSFFVPHSARDLGYKTI